MNERFLNLHSVLLAFGWGAMMWLCLGYFFGATNSKIKEAFRKGYFRWGYAINWALLGISTAIFWGYLPNHEMVKAEYVSAVGVFFFLLLSLRVTNEIEKKHKYLFYCIDDEADMLELLSEKLTNMFDCKVLLFKSVKEAAEKLDDIDFIPDLIFCDIRMPSGSGFFIRSILLEKKYSIPVIFLSGLAGDDVVSPDTIVLSKNITDNALKKEIYKAIDKKISRAA